MPSTMQAHAVRTVRDQLRSRLSGPRAQLAEILADPQLTNRQREKATAPLVAEIAEAGTNFTKTARQHEARARAEWLANLPHARRVHAFASDPLVAHAVKTVASDLPASDLALLARSATEGTNRDAVLYGVEAVLNTRPDIAPEQQSRVRAELDRPFVEAHDRALANYVVARAERASVEAEALPDPHDRRVLQLANEARVIPPEEPHGEYLNLSDGDLHRMYAKVGIASPYADREDE